MNRPLNKEQVKVLFEQEAVLMGTENCVPDFRAAALFGGDAVEHARKMGASKPGYYTSGVRCWRLHDGSPDPAGLSGRRQFL